MELTAIDDFKATEITKSRPRLRVWRPFMEKYHIETICEVGVQWGFNFRKMIEHSPKLAVAVDSWVNDGTLARNDCAFTQEELDRQYEEFRAEMLYTPFVTIYRGYSFNVAKKMEDETFDLIYIDADHTYEGIKRDLNDWYPKVKKGGMFCGHDYVNKIARTPGGHLKFEVARAVDEFVRDNNISTFFTTTNQTWGLIK
jgi:hypothetical protein